MKIHEMKTVDGVLIVEHEGPLFNLYTHGSGGLVEEVPTWTILQRRTTDRDGKAFMELPRLHSDRSVSGSFGCDTAFARRAAAHKALAQHLFTLSSNALDVAAKA